VSTEQALKHPEVLEQIQSSIGQLQALTDQFLNKIVTSLDSIPYVTKLTGYFYSTVLI
jgi:hypothetical protein